MDSTFRIPEQQPVAGRPQPAEPPIRFREAVEAFAAMTGLDADQLVNGVGFECNGVRFSLMHFGQYDAESAVLFMDMGEVEEPVPAHTLRFLLEHNALSAAYRDGYYGMLPHTNTIVYGLRIPLTEAQADAERIGATAGALATGINAIQHLALQMKEAAEQEAAQSDNAAFA